MNIVPLGILPISGCLPPTEKTIKGRCRTLIHTLSTTGNYAGM